MNNRIPPDRFDGYLRFLERAIVHGRFACQAGDAPRGEAILDAIHNLPRFLRGEEQPAFEADFVPIYVQPLVERYPDLHGLLDEVPRPSSA